MAQQFFGKLTNVNPIGSGSNSYVRVRGDILDGSNQITNIVGVSGYKSGSEYDFLKVGMVLEQLVIEKLKIYQKNGEQL